MEKSKNEYCVFLNEQGMKVLSYLEDIYVRDGYILDCIEVLPNNPRYLEVKARMQEKYNPNHDDSFYAHFLIPHEFVSLVVLEIKDNPVGFAPE